MKFHGERRLGTTPPAAWDALLRADVLRASIPGCERVEQVGEGQYDMLLGLKIGPLAPRLTCTLRIADARPGEGCTLRFEGQAGALGFGRGSAVVSLHSHAEGTRLCYEAEVQVAGKLAQLGSRLIDATARQLVEAFFSKFETAILEAAPASSTAAERMPEQREAGAIAPFASPWATRAAAIALALGLLVWVVLR